MKITIDSIDYLLDDESINEFVNNKIKEQKIKILDDIKYKIKHDLLEYLTGNISEYTANDCINVIEEYMRELKNG